ncbi:MAG TPA: MFS transporter [Bacillota bacterium]
MPRLRAFQVLSARGVIATATALALTLPGDSLLYVVLPLYAESLGIPLALAGVLLSINRLVRLVSNELAGRMFLRWGSRLPLLGAAAAAAASTFGCAWPWGFWPFLVSRVAWGMAYSHLRLGAYLAVLAEPPQQRGALMGLSQGISRIGSVLAVLAGGALIDRFGYTPIYLVLSVLALVALPVLWVEVPAAPAPPALTRGAANPGCGRGGGLAERPGAERGARLRRSVAGLWPSAAEGSANLFGAALHAAVAIATASVSLLLLERLGPQPRVVGVQIGLATLSGFLVSLRWGGSIIMAPILGKLSDRYGRPALLVWLVLAQVMALLVLALGRELWLLALAFALCVLSIPAAMSILEAHVGDLVRSRPELAMSRFAIWCDLGAAVGPVLGITVGATVSLAGAYLATAAVLAAAGLWVVATGRGSGLPLAAGDSRFGT